MRMWKENLRRKFIEELFDKQTEMNRQDLVGLFDRNNKLQDGYYDIFVYKNVRYRRHNRVKSWAAGISLSVELYEDMELISKERDLLCADRRTLEAWFRAMCVACGSYENVILELPDCLLKYVSNTTKACKSEHTLEGIAEYRVEVVRSLNTDQIIEIVTRRQLNNLLLGDL